MKFVLDTSAYSAYNRGDERLKKWFRTEHTILVPLIVVGELRAGFAAGNKQDANELLLQKFLDASVVSTLTITDMTTRLFAEIYLNLRQAGRPIGTNDLWIAAMTMEQGMPLLTLDADFSAIPNLKTLKI